MFYLMTKNRKLFFGFSKGPGYHFSPYVSKAARFYSLQSIDAVQERLERDGIQLEIVPSTELDK